MKLKDLGLSILILDTDAKKNQELSTSLNNLGVEKIRVLPDFNAAEEYLQKEKYHIVIIGDDFSDASAKDALHFLQKHSNLKKMPYLLHTSSKDAAFIREIVSEGKVSVLAYPTFPQNVERAVMNCLRSEESKEFAKLIKESDFFDEFTGVELQTLLKVGSSRFFHAGEEIISKGDPADCFYVLLKGKLAILINVKKTIK